MPKEPKSKALSSGATPATGARNGGAKTKPKTQTTKPLFPKQKPRCFVELEKRRPVGSRERPGALNPTRSVDEAEPTKLILKRNHESKIPVG